MNEYLSETSRKIFDEFYVDVGGLISGLEGKRIQRYVSITSGMDEAHLAELCNGKTASAMEFLALCNAICYCSERLPGENINHISKLADELRINWMEKMFDKATGAMNIVDNLLAASGKANEVAFLNDYHFFLDASSLCSDGMPIFLDKLLPAMQSYECPLRIIVPQAVVNCLNEWSRNPKQAIVSKSDKGLCQIKRIQDADFLSVRGDEGDSTIMSTFISAFSRFKPIYSMVLITQDEVLANAVHLLNSSGVEGNDILIASLQKDGILSMWFQTKENSEFKANDQSDDRQEVMVELATSEEELEDIVNVNHLLYLEEDLEEEWTDPLEENKFDTEDELEEDLVATVQIDSWSTLE